MMDTMGAVGEDTPEPSEGVEVVDVDVATAATERLNPATTTERMLLRTARSLPKVRCATTANSEVAADRKTKVCKECGGRGHGESKCPSPADMETALAVELPGSDEEYTTSSVGAAGFMAEEVDAVCGHLHAHVASGKCDGSVVV